MIFEPGATKEQKLSTARAHFLVILGQTSDARNAMERAFRFRHGDQWDEDAKKQLETEGRHALTFNLLGAIMRELNGAQQDQRREPRLAPVGRDDLALTEAMNHLARRFAEAGRFSDVEDEVFEAMSTGGVGYAFLDAHASSEDPDELEITLDAVSPFEIAQDPMAQRRNFDDWQIAYWHRWMAEPEFAAQYPDVDFDEVAGTQEVASETDPTTRRTGSQPTT